MTHTEQIIRQHERLTRVQMRLDQVARADRADRDARIVDEILRHNDAVRRRDLIPDPVLMRFRP